MELRWRQWRWWGQNWQACSIPLRPPEISAWLQLAFPASPGWGPWLAPSESGHWTAPHSGPGEACLSACLSWHKSSSLWTAGKSSIHFQNKPVQQGFFMWNKQQFVTCQVLTWREWGWGQMFKPGWGEEGGRGKDDKGNHSIILPNYSTRKIRGENSRICVWIS